MNATHVICPDDETLAAFAEGVLPSERARGVRDHLRECDDCIEVTGAASGFVSEREPTLTRSFRRHIWWGAVAAAILVAVIVAPVVRERSTSPTPLQRLISAAPAAFRDIEPRLSGFAHAQLRPVVRSDGTARDAAQLKFRGAAGDVLQVTSGRTDVASRHAAAMATVVAGEPEKALAILESIPAGARTPSTWNDLAATRYLVANQARDDRGLQQALAEVGRGTSIAEAGFNRALILEALGRKDEARAEWENFLRREPKGGWSDEARERVKRLR